MCELEALMQQFFQLALDNKPWIFQIRIEIDDWVVSVLREHTWHSVSGEDGEGLVPVLKHFFKYYDTL